MMTSTIQVFQIFILFFKRKGNLETARQLIEFGINKKTKNKIEVLSEKDFNRKRERVLNLRNQKETFKIKEIDCKKVKDPSIFKKEPFLKALAEREEAIANGKKLSILFLRLKLQFSNFQSQNKQRRGKILRTLKLH